MMSSFFRLIFYVLLFYLIYQVLRFFQALKKSQARSKKASTAVSSQIMVKDEVCQTYLPQDEAISLNFQGKTYYFCSEKCQQKFLAEVKKDKKTRPSLNS
ncbi:MAG: hypothetical protein DRI99_00320 [Candidatus Aminicenantes bacterium]|nr:MAG: hypothetical protein DRJ11_00895 [Candidatus Aminicenantes bacterium]RLE06211.1 MAG: hypothetical protein DRI99_00320 [Candidatus Aminicenantes bacterium]HHF42836.1 YHS domain-containing protein [Candidatus Aminicenantes bacterium]